MPQEFLHGMHGNNSSLTGVSVEVWMKKVGFVDYKEDFVVISPKYRDLDHFTSLVGNVLLKSFHRLIGLRMKVWNFPSISR